MSNDPADSRSSGPATEWSIIRRASEGAASDRTAALEQWLRIYGPVLEARLRFSWKSSDGTDAADLLQLFIQQKILQGNLLAGYEPARGKFRTYLLVALDRFVVDQWRRTKNAPAITRGDDLAGLAAAPTPDAFDVAWALQVILEGVRRMRATCQARKRPDLWTVFEGRVLGPLQGLPALPYRLLAERLRLESELKASNLFVTVERRFRRLVQDVIREYAGADVEEELRDLREILTRAGAELVEALRSHLWNQLPEVTVSTPIPHILDLRRLARALNSDDCPAEPGALLRHLLAAPMPFDVSGFGPEWADRFPGWVGAGGLTRSFADLFHHPNPPTGLLELAKEFAKDNRNDPDSLLPREVSTLLYYASIAAAFTKGQGRITRHDDDALRHGFRWALAQGWVDEATRALFQEALRQFDRRGRPPQADPGTE